MMPQNMSYEGRRSSVHHHIDRSSHHGQKNTGWLNGVVHAGCQATTSSSVDVTPLHSSCTVNFPNPVNGPDHVTKNFEGKQSSPKCHRKGNKNVRRTMKNPQPKMSNLALTPLKGEDWESEYQEGRSDAWQKMFGATPYGPEDVPLLAVTPTQGDLVLPVIGRFLPARDHPEPVKWLSLTASIEPGQFIDADH